MQQDIRRTEAYRKVQAIVEDLRRPGTGHISDATEIDAAPTRREVAFAGVVMDALEGAPTTRICTTNIDNGVTRILTAGPNTDRLPKFSPDGRHIAFLSDRHSAGDFQLYLAVPATGLVTAAPRVCGWIEYLHWSPDGKRILLGVAGHGADVAGGQGAVASKRQPSDATSWMPLVDTDDDDYRWRRIWVYELATEAIRLVSTPSANIWEAAWCGTRAVVAVISPGPAEGLWYSASLALIDVETGNTQAIYIPHDQLGSPRVAPSGGTVAVIEAICSDRGIVAGDLRLIDTATREVRRTSTSGVDVTFIEWRSEQHLLLAGHRGFETIVGLLDTSSSIFTEIWCSRQITTVGRYATISGINQDGDFVLIGEGFAKGPEIAVVSNGEYRAVKSLDINYLNLAKAIQAVECITWQAPDGLQIQGWLIQPNGTASYPLIMSIHGGPVGHWRPTWLGRYGIHILMLVNAGYAVLLPNPRGSIGRGQEYIAKVQGDMNGADTEDYLSGIDKLVAQGIADPKRLGVVGQSYGGNMTSWLISQDTRFAAAIAVAPHTNQVTQHLLSNIPQFTDLFLRDKYNNPNGKYFERSPIMYAHRVKTPTLQICGALDRCTPPEEGAQFHRALRDNGVKSVLVTYPEEGHGIRKYPAMLDYTARIVSWFVAHIPPAEGVLL